MDLGLRERVYIVTGGSTGLGFATAQALIADGARVVLSARDPGRLAIAAHRLATAPDRGGLNRGGLDRGEPMPDERVHAVPADNADPAAPARLIDAARDAFGRLDGALISSGGPPAGAAVRVTDAEWRDAFESVFLGAVRLAVAVGAELSDGGSIALVLSSSVRSPIASLAISNGLRPGLAGFTKTLADELGPAGIRVNGLAPGRIDTDRVRELDAARGDPAKVRADHARMIPLGRYGTPAEFGRVAAFVLSPAASYLTGTVICVDGGMIRSW